MGEPGVGDRAFDGSPVVDWGTVGCIVDCGTLGCTVNCGAVGSLNINDGSISSGNNRCALGDGSADRRTLGHANRGAVGFYNCRLVGFHDCSATNFHDCRSASCSYWGAVGSVTKLSTNSVAGWSCIQRPRADGCAVGCEGSWDVTSLREDGSMRGYLASRSAAALAPSVNLI